MVINLIGGDDVSNSSKAYSILSSPQDKIWFYVLFISIIFQQIMMQRDVINKSQLLKIVETMNHSSPLISCQIYLASMDFEKVYYIFINILGNHNSVEFSFIFC